jgi:uncharacterized protein (TIGR03437 family)
MKAKTPLTARLMWAMAASVFFPFAAQAAPSLQIVNAASQQSVSIAPGSIIAIYGSNLTAGTAVSPGAATPPTTLGGVTVTIGKSAAALYFVSPTQINAVVDPATPTGAQTLTVTSSTGTQQGPVTIDANAAPGLFSLNGAGSGDGAFVNALTALLGPFTPGTTNGATYLELFATGLSKTPAPVVTIGGVSAKVLFYGPSPCCAGLDQINVQVPLSLAGAGRVPVNISVNGQTSNTVEVLLLPASGQGEFSSDQDDHARARELASLASIPNTSLVLSTDENDDVVRVIDVAAKNVSKVIALSDGASPVGVAVDAAGKIAVVAERGLGNVAIIDLTKTALVAEVSTGAASSPVNVAIAGTLALSVNRDARTVSVIDLTTNKVTKTLNVGSGPRGIVVDSAGKNAYVTNEDDGTISVIDIAGLSVSSTVTLNANTRVEGIVLLGSSGFACVTVPASDQVLLVDLAKGVSTAIKADPAGGGSTDVAILNSNVYFANQAGGSVSVLPVDLKTGAATGAISSIKVDVGARALTIDVNDNLLVVSNEASGTLVLIDLKTNTVVGKINAVKSTSSGDDDNDDHTDHDGSNNGMPVVTSVTPSSGSAGSTFNITIGGSKLTGATDIQFDLLNGHGDDRHNAVVDSAFTVTKVQVNSTGTQVTASVAVASSAAKGPRLVRVVTQTGASPLSSSAAATFTIQ